MTDDQQKEAECDWRREADSRPPVQIDDPEARLDKEAGWISATLDKVLQDHAKPLRICVRSKRWWNADINQLRRVLSAVKQSFRQGQGTTRQAVKNARRSLRAANRRAKRKHWAEFLQQAGPGDTWTALRYANVTGAATATKGAPLSGQDGSKASTVAEKSAMMARQAFPSPPNDDWSDRELDGLSTDVLVEDNEVEKACWAQASRLAAGPDKLGPPAVRLVWKWHREGSAALARACVWQGYQPKPWRQATGVVIPKPGKDDYSQARSHRAAWTRL